MFTVEGSHIQLRPIAESDADWIVKWRNSKEAREGFFSDIVVTPDTHIAFVRKRKPHDLVWMVETVPTIYTVGTVSLTVLPHCCMAEFGRLFVDTLYRGSIYAEKIVYVVLYYGFEVLRLNSIWADVKTNNEHALELYTKVGFMNSSSLSLHQDAKIVHCCKEDWRDKGRNQFESLIEVELPPWE